MKTFITITILLAGYLWTDVHADETVDITETVINSSICAAASGLVASQMDGFVADEIAKVGKYWRGIALELTEDENLVDLLIERYMSDMKDRYNDGTISWKDLVDASESCGKMMVQLEYEE